MIIVMNQKASKDNILAVKNKVTEFGYTPHLIEGTNQTVIGAVGDKDKERLKSLIVMEGVQKIMPVLQPYKLASRTTKQEDTVVNVEGRQIGGGDFVVIGGPCSVESMEQTVSSAKYVQESGAQFLRGGAFKPRTSPYSFQGLGEEGLKILKQAKQETGLPVVTELLDTAHLDLVAEYADIVQIGARNMQNFALLKHLGRLKQPILLKRGLAATLEELLMSAEYIMSEGNYNIILCERGIRTYEKAYRNTLDLNAIPALKSMTHLPVVADPSHGTGRKDLIPAMSKAAIAAGADGIIIETHPKPEDALSDGPQSLTPEEFKTLMNDIKPFVQASGKTMTQYENSLTAG